MKADGTMKATLMQLAEAGLASELERARSLGRYNEM